MPMDRIQAEQIVTPQLDPGESLLWCGVPDPSRIALSTLPAALVGIPFAGFAAFWIYMAYTMTSKASRAIGPFAFFPLFGVPFLLVGLGVLGSPLWAYLAALRTAYAVTGQRAMIISRM